MFLFFPIASRPALQKCLEATAVHNTRFFSKMLTLVEHLVVYCLLKNYSETCVAVE